MPELICEAAFAQTMELVVEPALAAMRQQISMPLAGGTVYCCHFNTGRNKPQGAAMR